MPIIIIIITTILAKFQITQRSFSKRANGIMIIVVVVIQGPCGYIPTGGGRDFHQTYYNVAGRNVQYKYSHQSIIWEKELLPRAIVYVARPKLYYSFPGLLFSRRPFCTSVSLVYAIYIYTSSPSIYRIVKPLISEHILASPLTIRQHVKKGRKKNSTKDKYYAGCLLTRLENL